VRIFLGLIFAAFLGTACSTSKVYQPEVGGAGAQSSRGSVIYSIPPEQPVLKMKLVSAVEPKNKRLRVRMYFVRKGAPAGEFLDPREQALILPDTKEPLFPIKIHAIADAKPRIMLFKNERQVVELLYDVPKGGDAYPYIQLKWKIHYQKNGQPETIAQTERFDYVEKTASQQGVGQYEGSLEFPFIGEAPDIDSWYPDGSLWW
jgi:hypothetical protein